MDTIYHHISKSEVTNVDCYFIASVLNYFEDQSLFQ